MNGTSFPTAPGHDPIGTRPNERIWVREPLAPIRELLGISIHDIVNERRTRWLVAELYRVSRWIENELWLRREVEGVAALSRDGAFGIKRAPGRRSSVGRAADS